ISTLYLDPSDLDASGSMTHIQLTDTDTDKESTSTSRARDVLGDVLQRSLGVGQAWFRLLVATSATTRYADLDPSQTRNLHVVHASVGAALSLLQANKSEDKGAGEGEPETCVPTPRSCIARPPSEEHSLCVSIARSILLSLTPIITSYRNSFSVDPEGFPVLLETVSTLHTIIAGTEEGLGDYLHDVLTLATKEQFGLLSRPVLSALDTALAEAERVSTGSDSSQDHTHLDSSVASAQAMQKARRESAQNGSQRVAKMISGLAEDMTLERDVFLPAFPKAPMAQPHPSIA
ncbi:hypothetical protein KIPB_011162, partial [Kipferlia bialata]